MQFFVPNLAFYWLFQPVAPLEKKYFNFLKPLCSIFAVSAIGWNSTQVFWSGMASKLQMHFSLKRSTVWCECRSCSNDRPCDLNAFHFQLVNANHFQTIYRVDENHFTLQWSIEGRRAIPIFLIAQIFSTRTLSIRLWRYSELVLSNLMVELNCFKCRAFWVVWRDVLLHSS